MKRKIKLIDFQEELEKHQADHIGNDFVLFENPIINPIFNYPFITDSIVGVICTKGTMKGSVNLKSYCTKAPSLFIVFPDQILEYKEFSDDFEGKFVIMSTEFTDKMIADNKQDKLPLANSIKNHPCVSLTQEEVFHLSVFYDLLKHTVRRKENKHRSKIVRLLIMAFFLGVGYKFHQIDDPSRKTNKDILVDKFMNLVQENYKTERSIGFYAGKLALTPKYLSKVIKETTNKSALDWINMRVVLEIKAMLRSTDMSVKEISYALNFPSQSFLGKYFKRIEGISPKAYREQIFLDSTD